MIGASLLMNLGTAEIPLPQRFISVPWPARHSASDSAMDGQPRRQTLLLLLTQPTDGLHRVDRKGLLALRRQPAAAAVVAAMTPISSLLTSCRIHLRDPRFHKASPGCRSRSTTHRTSTKFLGQRVHDADLLSCQVEQLNGLLTGPSLTNE